MSIKRLVSLTVVALAAIAEAAPSEAETSLQLQGGAKNAVLTFECSEMKEVCSNMCHGAYCTSPAVGLTLTNDKASSDVKRARRKAAGCIASGGNRCSTKKGAPKGLSCDEYPFASTTGTQRFNRCVPARENSKQGGAISSFYKKNCDKACTFTIGFSGDSGIPNCAKKCEIDGIVTGPGSTTPPTSTDIAGDGTDDQDWKRNAAGSTLGGRYRTSSGMEISVPAGASIGQLVYWVQPKNATLWHLQAMDRELNPWAYDEELDGFEDMIENSILREEVVVEEIPWMS